MAGGGGDEDANARTLYAVLDVPADASPDQIKKSYRKLALQHHPDRFHQGNAAEAESEDTTTAFARIAFAYEVLGNEQRRKRYDLTGEVPQNDAALGRKAGDTFLAEYVRAAPKAARHVTQADMSLHNLSNYEVLEVEGRDVPDYMRAIVMRGLSYLVAVVAGMEEKEVVLLRHYVMDQMYALLAFTAPLDDGAFQQRGYIITYYDHPLQHGIQAKWSDQNEEEHRKEGLSFKEVSHLRDIPSEIFQQRKLVALEWHGGGGLATTEPEQAQAAKVPGSGFAEDRLLLGVRSLLKSKVDLESCTIHDARQQLEKVLDLEYCTLDKLGATTVFGLIYEAMDTLDEEPPTGPVPEETEVRALQPPSGPVPEGTKVRVLQPPPGRMGSVVIHDPTDAEMTFKVAFDDGSPPDWFPRHVVEVA